MFQHFIFFYFGPDHTSRDNCTVSKARPSSFSALSCPATAKLTLIYLTYVFFSTKLKGSWVLGSVVGLNMFLLWIEFQCCYDYSEQLLRLVNIIRWRKIFGKMYEWPISGLKFVFFCVALSYEAVYLAKHLQCENILWCKLYIRMSSHLNSTSLRGGGHSSG